MKINGTYGLMLLFLVLGQSLVAQQHLFSRVNVNQNAVFVGQPVEVTVSVFTSTWFTKGVNPGNVKVNGAFTVYFRSVSSSERIDGKTYAGVSMIYNVFPYDEEDIVFPSLEINVETPDEGSSKGVQKLVTTKSKSIVVKPVPPNYKRDEWMVATSVSVSENWKGDRANVKVGNVLERYVIREVQGSVAELIPPIHWDTISGISNYPSRAEVKNNKTRTSISASRTDGVKYLFEEEGEFVIPELVVSWWNPRAGRMQKRTLKEVIVNVHANPDLGMLKSIRDSLSVTTALAEGEAETKKRSTIFGLSYKELVLALTLLLLFIYIVYRIFAPLKKAYLYRREQYRNSEKFYFNKYLKAARMNNRSMALQSLYRWIDQLKLQEPSLTFFAEQYGSSALLAKVQQQGDSAIASEKFIFEPGEWSDARRNYKSGKANEGKETRFWINP